MEKMSKPQQLGWKSATPWDRLRPVKQHPLESMGFVSKGDTRLLDPKAQESFYNQIVARYMQFCSHHPKDLGQALTSLLQQGESVADKPSTGSISIQKADLTNASPPPTLSTALTANEMSVILTALRKLREGLLASSATANSLAFAQRVHVFNIRLAILAGHPESYHPSLRYLVTKLHTSEEPLPRTELFEMISYLILDLAVRQGDLGAAFALRHNSGARFGYSGRNIDMILRSIVTNDWVLFWTVRRKVDGYVRSMLQLHALSTPKLALKAIGSSYMSCDVRWILYSTSDGELQWDELVKQEDIGWIREGDKVIIRKAKPKPHKQEPATKGV